MVLKIVQNRKAQNVRSFERFLKLLHISPTDLLISKQKCDHNSCHHKMWTHLCKLCDDNVKCGHITDVSMKDGHITDDSVKEGHITDDSVKDGHILMIL